MNNDLDSLLEKLDLLVRHGQIQTARSILLAQDKKRISRKFVVKFAKIARRVQLPFLGIQLLNPIVRSETPLSLPPTTEELVTYAANLSRIGASVEAQEILESLSSKDNPEVLFFRAAIHVRNLSDAAAIPIFKSYIRHSKITSYERLVAKVNLSACYLAEWDKDSARILIEENLKETKSQGHLLLHANTLELAAQMAIQTHDYDLAEKYLDESIRILKEGSHRYNLYVKKWRCLGQLQKSSDPKSVLEELKQVKQEAFQLGEWETLRECDLYQAVTTRDEKLFQHILAGSPFRKYRRRLCLKYGDLGSVPVSYTWQMGNTPSKRVFDMEIGKEVSSEIKLNPGKTCHRMIQILASDFYRPLRLGQIFNELFPGEYFSPFSSPNRVFHVIQRLRTFFAKNEIPLKISVRSGNFSFLACDAYAILVKPRKGMVEGNHGHLARLKMKWPYQVFSSPQAAKALDISLSTVHRILKAASADGKVYQSGEGRSRRYRFSK